MPDVGDFARALLVLEGWLERRRLGTAEPAGEVLARHEDLREVLEPMLADSDDGAATPTLAAATAMGASGRAWRGLPGDGDCIGGYRIESVLGQGGMGIVFAASDPQLQRRVALKLVRPERLGSPEARERFWREAKLAARLEHPHICPVYEVGEEGGVPFMAMRLLEGETLAARLAARAGAAPTRGRIDGVLRLIEQVADALHYAHERGVVHRDIKPGNILVEPDGNPVVLDFGMARGDDDLALTMTGELAGTPLYMSPEQVASPHGRPVDRRSDVYSLAVTLYEVLTGSCPHSGASMRELFEAIATSSAPRPSSLDPSLPRDLDVVLAKALDKDPDRRYRTAADFAADLARVRTHTPVLARPAGRLLRTRRWVQRNPLQTALFAVLAVSLPVITFLYLRARSETRRAERNWRDFTLVSLVPELADLRAQVPQLYSGWPDHAEALAAWLQRSEALAAQMPAVRALLARDDGDGRDAGVDRFLRDNLELLVRDHDALAGGAAVQVRGDLSRARSERAATIDAHAEAWARAAAAVAADPRFPGLQLRPQQGLVPLAADPVTGLWEFAHPASGATPERRGDGTLRVTDDTGLVFVLLPGGAATIGAQREDAAAEHCDPLARREEGPVHTVPLDPFLIAKHEMTQGQWLRLAGHNPSEAHPGALRIPITLAHPVENVSWHECTALLPRFGLALPTEVQWEYACRGGGGTPWWTGGEAASLSGKVNLADRAARAAGARWSEIDDSLDDGFVWHAPVDALPANGFGLHGVAGNVLEWCRDTYASYRDAEARPGDGLRADGPGEKVLRGGSFDGAPVHVRSAMRRTDDPASHANDAGLRPVRRLR